MLRHVCSNTALLSVGSHEVASTHALFPYAGVIYTAESEILLASLSEKALNVRHFYAQQSDCVERKKKEQAQTSGTLVIESFLRTNEERERGKDISLPRGNASGDNYRWEGN